MNDKIDSKHIQNAIPDWNLLLYIAGWSPKSTTAFDNLKKICNKYLAGRYRIKVVDLMKNPRIARDEQIVAVPTVVHKSPKTSRRVIGDLSNTERVIAGLRIPLPSPL